MCDYCEKGKPLVRTFVPILNEAVFVGHDRGDSLAYNDVVDCTHDEEVLVFISGDSLETYVAEEHRSSIEIDSCPMCGRVVKKYPHEFSCTTCGGNDPVLEQEGPHVALRCKMCGAWQRWVSKKDLRRS